MLDPDTLKELYTQASNLVGRPVEVVTTKDGKFVVEWFAHGAPPPPKAMSVDGALMAFIGHIKNHQPPHEEEVGGSGLAEPAILE